MQTDSTTSAALAATVSRLGWCEALSAALGSGYRVVWRDAGDAARVTLTMSGTLPISEQRVHISAQPASVSCSSGTPTKTLLESADGTRWALLERMVPLVDGSGSPLAPVTGAGFRWVDPLVVQPPAGLSALPAWLQDAPLLTWMEIPGTSIYDQRAALGLTSSEANNITSYSSGAWGGARFYAHGGGHGDIAGNGVFCLDLLQDAPAWSVVSPPRPAGTRDAATTDDGYYHPYDGSPVEMHSYWCCHVDSVRGKFFRLSSGGSGSALDGRAPTVDAMTIATGTWDGKGVYPDVPINAGRALDGASVAMDTSRRIWVLATPDGSSQRMAYFDLTSLAWQILGAPAGGIIDDVPLVYDPVRKWLFRPRQQYNTNAQTFEIGDGYAGGLPSATSRTLTAVGDADLAQVRSACSMDYCADRDSYVSVKWANRALAVHEIEPDSWQVSVMPVAGAVPTLPGSLSGREYYYARWRYVAEIGGLFFMPRADANCRFLRTR